MRQVLFITLLVMVQSVGQAARMETFQEAKAKLYSLYADNRVSLYCGCPFDSKKKVDLKKCGYKIRKNRYRARRVEAEHIVPVWAFAHTLPCWREKLCQNTKGKKYGGRACCHRIDPRFREMENDLMNLAPAIGEINQDRSNYSFTDFGGKAHDYGQCDFVVDRKNRQVQPPKHTRGLIARTYFYMSQQYDIPISEKQMKLYMAWHKQYPLSE